ncbi:glycoside hydrolase family 2 protein [Clostridium grantii]|uniref:Glycosyl hydrolases family 2 n=1 Tax=Clostridium grantii DSM 8605 TaxID=1121316 RepID=A0A1M5WQB4_9CLOT|nr:sugar-binding domain-containing protein [Clostridium grantii]SHH89727.1 Glycosyl hydrolases family 2 [Clostridium grantii DSM 8605]
MRGKEIISNWKFNLGDIKEAHLLSKDDTQWRTINLPHDWSVELPFNKEEGEACTGFLLGGIGWYRKHFKTAEDMIDKRVIVNFDGIYCRSTIYCNGEMITFHPNGYTPVLADITKYLNPLNEENVIAVRVDHSRHADSRWYTGSGIYRKVSMHILPKVHIPVWGVSVITPKITDLLAEVEGNVELVNEFSENQDIEVLMRIIDEEGKKVVEEKQRVKLSEHSSSNIKFNVSINNPVRWEVLNSHLYKAEVCILKDNNIIQTEIVKFGVREFKFDADKGFFINSKRTLIKGVCLHHDGGAVGAAVPLDVWRRRLDALILCGCNAIRTAHNQVSEDFLDLCDELGILVQEEFFDEWDNPKDKRQNGEEKTVDYLSRCYTEFFREYAQDDLQNTIKRDINHPSIIQWSIGNEIEWTYTKYNNATGYFGIDADGSYFWKLPPNDIDVIKENISKIPRDYYDVGTTAKKLANWTKEMDTTRPIIANCILPSVSYETGYTDALDIVGYSYRRVIYDYGHTHYPEKPIMGTENVPQWHEWKAVLEKEHIAGTFLWTGCDHIGEAQVQGPWPRKGSNLGLIDLAGFDKPSYHMFKGLWNEEPHIKIFTQTLDKSLYNLDKDGILVEKEKDAWQKRLWFWHDVNPHWNYMSEEGIVVEVYSNCEEVSLYVNDELVSTRHLNEFEDNIYKWFVPYTEGTVKAIGRKGNKKVENNIPTTGPIDKIDLTTDKNIIKVSSDSVAHIVVQLVDKQGHPVKIVNEELFFNIKGNAKILGVDNGHPDNVQNFQNNSIVTSQGRALMILQAIDEGQIEVVAICKTLGLKSAPCKIQAIR